MKSPKVAEVNAQGRTAGPATFSSRYHALVQ
jgi:hypothetical protein